MCLSLDQSHLSCFTSLIFIIWFHTGRLKKCILYYRPNLRLCLQSARYKFCNLTSFIWLWRKSKNNNISLKFIMLTNRNQIFTNCFVIIYCHVTKVSSQINKFIIFEPNELSITLSTSRCWYTLWFAFVSWIKYWFVVLILWGITMLSENKNQTIDDISLLPNSVNYDIIIYPTNK